ncbi:MAG: PSD1 and planctomycete cytochrome C domain-containing protein [Planctomycetota bacterium]|nr:PSD1 and planctomycete cytochrome C domain-containing protein [Planctomycetota bacterium]
MKSPRMTALVLLAVCFGSVALAGDLAFNKDIRPILAEHCLSCHGPGKKNGGLRLDQPEAAFKGGKSGAPAVVAGKPEKSALIERIHSDVETERMPPASTRKVLTDREKATLKQWVAQGGKFEGHWAFQPIQTVTVPAGEGSPIDRFLQARLAQAGLTFRQEASRPTLIRRVSFTLTGLPPTLAEVDQYLADQSPGAYERMVDRYFNSPRHGEEMARHWLDLARYADTHGLHLDNERQMWAYRDWVINSFNRNQPFDQFATQQLAGDLLPNATVDQKVATGFLRCGPTTGEGGSIDAEWIYRNAVERTSTVFTAFLGLTGGCAQCHDHKFDPISAKDFYSLYAFFHSAADPAMDGNALLTAPTVKLETAAVLNKKKTLDESITRLKNELKALAAAEKYIDPASIKDRPTAVVKEDLWFDDAFPTGAKVGASPGQPTRLVDAASGKVHSGKKAVHRVDAGLAQDVIEGMPAKTLVAGSRLFAQVYLDPANPPKAIMLQYYTSGWLHRAVWGDYGVIDWGKANTTERVHMGKLPETGKWVKLEMDAARLGITPATPVTGFALTQFGGSVHWDRVGAETSSDPSADTSKSLAAWWKSQKGKDQPEADAPEAGFIKDGPEAKRTDAEKDQVLRHYLARVSTAVSPKIVETRNHLAESKTARAKIDGDTPGSFIFTDLPNPRESHVMMRGAYDKPGTRVEPTTPAVLPPLAVKGRRATRLDLARWLLSPEQPLTARVTVNRFWQQIFGNGLVRSSGDFGTQGDMPGNPELLDHLASGFRQGWDVRALFRQMLTSKAFRQDSAAPSELWLRDPENKLLARGPRFRLDAEQVRDNALFLGGLLKENMGGRGTLPYQPPNIWEPVGFTGSNTRNYTQDKGEKLYTRSIYVFLKRTAPAPFMSNFDAPNRETACIKRERSNTPLQALQLMNDVQHVEAARGLAARLIHGEKSDEARIALAYRLTLSREPSADEKRAVGLLLERELARYRKDTAAAAKLARVGESPVPAGIAEPELAAWTLVSNLVLNLDETINRN